MHRKLTSHSSDLDVLSVLYDCSYIFFFFSSRRRHTRLQGDWSSDVCSSDLTFGNGRQSEKTAPGTPCRDNGCLPRLEAGRTEIPRRLVRASIEVRWGGRDDGDRKSVV